MLMKNNIISELKKTLTPQNVLTEQAERYAYAQDAANLPRIKGLPDAVVFVENIGFCRKHRTGAERCPACK